VSRNASDASRLPAAVVFDCDGTLVDTEPIANGSWIEVLARRGYAPTADDVANVLGRHYQHTFAYYDRKVGGLGDPDDFRNELRGVFSELFDRDVALFDDAVTTCRELHAAGVPIAVASSSSRGHIARVIGVCGLDGCVAAYFGADDLSEHKPHPEPYLAAARALGVPAGDCVAVEDSRVGIASAKAAGMFTIAVRRGHVPDADLAAADRVVDRLTLTDLGPR
jgi:HAD superfamily hydrolase (TIGR01509 family)